VTLSIAINDNPFDTHVKVLQKSKDDSPKLGRHTIPQWVGASHD
jgi:hypothetical protein